MTPSIATEKALEIERVVAGGDGLARDNSLVVFVPRTLEGEQIRARVSVKGRLARGELVEIERPSPARVPAMCPHYEADACGGCQIQHASYGEQLRIKSGIVVEAMRRIAKRDIEPPTIRPAVSPWKYRRKLTLTIRGPVNARYAGLRRHEDPDAVFSLGECPITADEVLNVWHAVMALAEDLPDAPELRGAVRVDADGSTSLAIDGGDAWPGAMHLFETVTTLGSLWWTPARGKRHIIARRDPREDAPEASFAQINEVVGTTMLSYVLDLVRARKPAHVIDAYAGVGDGAVLLAKDGIRVTAIELDHDAAEWAAKRLHKPSEVVNARVEEALPDALPADVVIVNPPRTGLDARVCATLSSPTRPPPSAIVYVSCDPATLARDLGRLKGWRIVSLTCFDMFPQTAHVETVCELVPDAA